MSAWQPIETAPRDNIAVLGYVRGRSALVAWVSSRQTRRKVEATGWLWWRKEVITTTHADTSSWYCVYPTDPGSEFTYETFGEPINPTHWQPLPEPPTPTPACVA